MFSRTTVDRNALCLSSLLNIVKQADMILLPFPLPAHATPVVRLVVVVVPGGRPGLGLEPSTGPRSRGHGQVYHGTVRYPSTFSAGAFTLEIQVQLE